MKKIISLILSLLITISSLSVGFTAYAEIVENNAVNNFIENTCNVVQKFDDDKNFEITDEENDFQTCRLVVKSSGGFDTQNAIKHIKGFEDYHILQYKSETDAEKAYNALLNDDNVLSVSIDKIVASLQAAEEDDTSSNIFPESSNGHLCDWATDRTQSAQVNEYINQNNLPLKNITVGVVDTGVDYNHEFLQGRIKRTGFNCSPDGKENDELDLINGHGTAVASVIVDNTPDCVKIASYRIFGDEGLTSGVISAVGLLQAVEDGVDIINASFNGPEYDGITISAVEYAYENGIAVVSCAGNERRDIGWNYLAPTNADKAIAVAATDENNRYCHWSNRGLKVDVSAPGESINVAVPNNRYDIWSGTSFSSPCVAGIIALIKCSNPDYSYDKILEMLKSSAIDLEEYYSSDVAAEKGLENSEDFKLIKDQIGMFGAGLIQIGSIFGLNQPNTPSLNYQGGNYQNGIAVEIYSDFPVYYTTDGTYPSTSSILYTEPVEITVDTDFRVVAYDDNSPIKYSNEVEAEYQIFHIPTDDMFDIDESGCITSFISDEKNLIIPEEVNGITVSSFKKQVFNNDVLEKIILPDTLDEIPESAFADNDAITYVNTGGAKIVNKSAFYQNMYLFEIEMPNVTEIETEAFLRSYGIYDSGFKVTAPKLEEIKNNGFYTCGFFTICAPELTTLYSKSFFRSGIRCAVFPKLKYLKKSSVYKYAPFYECPSVLYVDFPSLESSELPMIFYKVNLIQYINIPNYFGKISSNSTYDYLKYCNITKESADLSGIEYKNVNALGGSIRVTDAGLRFGFSIDDKQGKIKEYGFVYASGERDAFNINSQGVRTLVANNRITHDDGTTTYNLVFTKIPQTAYDSVISARAYVVIDGRYYYSDVLQRSFNSVAQAILDDEDIDQRIKQSIELLY